MALKGKKVREKNSIEYESSIVTFIDVLGFRSLVESGSAAEVHNVISQLQHFTQSNEPSSYRKLSTFARVRSVSDAVVRIRTYKTRYRSPVLLREIHDLFRAQIALVDLGVLVRGGLTVGDVYVGARKTDPVFGPAMVRAYEIESQEAIFPRIVIDEYALERHNKDELLRSDDRTLPEEEKWLGRFLATGDDGTRFIDYLQAAADFSFHSPEHYKFLQKHAELIRNGRQNKNRSVRRKYEWLAIYHNKHVAQSRRDIESSERKTNWFVSRA